MNLEEASNKILDANNIEVRLLETEKFKTNTIMIFLHDDLSKYTASLNAIVPAVLRRGSVLYPAFKDISLKLQELYGASFDCGVAKKGDKQIIYFYIDYPYEKFVNEKYGNIFMDAAKLLFNTATSPVLENGIFKNDYIKQEKDILIQLIKSRINDKMQYAVDRCFELLCDGEPYSVCEYGTEEDVKNINAENAYNRFCEIISSCPCSIYLCGRYTEAQLFAMREMIDFFPKRSIKTISQNQIAKPSMQLRTINENMSVNQVKLSIGYYTQTEPTSPEYASLVLFNSIFGGGIHSKLFQNVREKEGLAYYAYSRIDRFKGLMVASCGIDASNTQKVADIVDKQIDDIINGDISDYEMEASLKSVLSSLAYLKDSQFSLCDYYYSQTITGSCLSIQEFCEKINEVSKYQVSEIANKIKKGLVYSITPCKKEECQ